LAVSIYRKMTGVVLAAGLSFALATLLSAQSPNAANLCKPEMMVQWDGSKHQFVCAKIDGSEGESFPIDHTIPGTTFQSDKDKKDFCGEVLSNLLRACPLGAQGTICKQRAEAIYSRCLGAAGGGSAGSNSGGPGNDTAVQTDANDCRKAFEAQANACRRRKRPVPSPGQPPAPDTCLADAIATRDNCLAASKHSKNSRVFVRRR